MALSKCTRANGLPHFSDRAAGPGGSVGVNGLMEGPNGSFVVDGITFAGPAFCTARKTCAEYLAPNGPPSALSASQKAAALANAECMRKRGVPNFPDPTFATGGAANVNLGPGLNPLSTAFERAASECGLGRIPGG